MSYSRWLNSRWYTYWSVNAKEDDPIKYKKDQEFNVDCTFTFTYKDITKPFGVMLCINKIKKYEKEEDCQRLTTQDEYKELIGYMKQFIRDVKKDKELK